MALTAHFKWATPLTVEVRFYAEGTFENRDPFVGACNIHLRNGPVEVSMLSGCFGHDRSAYKLVMDWLSKRGVRRIYVERNGRIKEISTA